MFHRPFIRNIVVAVSGSIASVHAAKYAIMLAKRNKSNLTAVYVADTESINELISHKIFLADEGKEWEQSLKLNGQRYLDFVEELAKAKGLKITPELRCGSIANEIVNAAAEKDADLIILSGFEKDQDKNNVISKIHKNIICNAKCSVLLAQGSNIDKLYRSA
jgi:nucleotide-binding universal stress UspA family protein